MKEEIAQLESLRNERKPCHFWVDNEVADCYQPIVGADAIWVYCRIARYANGAWIVSPRLRGSNDRRVGLREMAEWCGKSVDTVSRSLEVLELVGLLRAERSGGRSKGRYALADVKDLVLREGGQYDRDLGGFRLPGERVASLKESVRQLRLKLSRKSQLRIVEVDGVEVEAAALMEAGAAPVESPTSPRGTIGHPADKDRSSGTPASVAQSDSLSEVLGDENAFAYVAGSDSSVALDAQICTSSATAIQCIREARNQDLKTTPPTPSLREGDAVLVSTAAAFDREVQSAVDQVCDAIGAVWNRRRRTMLAAVIERRVRAGESPPEVAALMVKRWNRQAEVSEFLRCKLGLMKFFGDGYWENENRWFWDEEKWRLHCESRAGSFR